MYSEPFWESNFQGLHPIWLSESVQEAFGVNRDRDNWTRGIASFKPVHSHKNALCAYISGYECVEELTDQEIVTECTKLLRKLMGTNIPEPKCILRFSLFIYLKNIVNISVIVDLFFIQNSLEF